VFAAQIVMYKRSAEPVRPAPGRAAQTCLIRVVHWRFTECKPGQITPTGTHPPVSVSLSKSGETDFGLKKKSQKPWSTVGGHHWQPPSFSPPNPRACPLVWYTAYGTCRVGVRGCWWWLFWWCHCGGNVRYPRSFPSVLLLSYIDLVAHASDSTEGFAAHTHPGRSFPHYLGLPTAHHSLFLKTVTCVVAWVYVLHATRDSNEAELFLLYRHSCSCRSTSITSSGIWRVGQIRGLLITHGLSIPSWSGALCDANREGHEVY
jgi:hypothetical protein